MNLEGLSEHDKAVLNSIFSPPGFEGIDVNSTEDVFLEVDEGRHSDGGRGHRAHHPMLPAVGAHGPPLAFHQRFTEDAKCDLDLPDGKQGEVHERRRLAKRDIIPKIVEPEHWLEARSLCSQGVKLAEEGKVQEALSLLEDGVAAAPDRAAGYNDRAQLLRLLQRDDDAMTDLEKALQLTAGKRTRARAQALCQKGVLLRKQKKDDEARPLFNEAAKLGSSFAKQQAVELNPYAALCNQMLSQVMRGDSEIKL